MKSEIEQRIKELLYHLYLQHIQSSDALEYHVGVSFEIRKQIEEIILKLKYGEGWEKMYEKEIYKHRKRKIMENLGSGKILEEFVEAIEWYVNEIDSLLREGHAEISKVNLLMLKAYVLFKFGKRWKAAEETLTECIKLDPGNKYAIHFLGSVYYKLHNPTRALETLDKLGDDPLALKTKLEIYTELGDMENGEKIYRKLQKFIKETTEEKPLTLLSIKFACFRYQVKRVEMLGNAERTDVDQMYEDLISSIPDGLCYQEAVIKNFYASYLIDSGDREKKEKGLKILRENCEKFPQHVPSMDKICSAMLKESAGYVRENQAIIRGYIKRMLEIDPLHRPALLYKARLEAKVTVWEAINREAEFWERARKVYSMFQEALEKGEEEPSFHNMIVHFDTGCFLWHIEKIAHRKGYKSKGDRLPSADSELIKSLKIAEKFKKEGRLTRKIKEHLILVDEKLGEYLIVAKGDESGYSLLEKAWNLSREMNIPFRFYSKNAKVRAFIDFLSLSYSENLLASANLIENIETLLKIDPYSMFLGKKALSTIISYLQAHPQDVTATLIWYFIKLLERYADIKDELQERYLLFFRKNKKIYKIKINEAGNDVEYEIEVFEKIF